MLQIEPNRPDVFALGNILLFDDDVIFGRLRVLDANDRCCSQWHRRTGCDLHCRAGRHFYVEHKTRCLLTNHLAPGRTIAGHYRVAIHGRCWEWRMIFVGNDILGEHAPARVSDGNTLDRKRTRTAQDDLAGLVGMKQPLKIAGLLFHRGYLFAQHESLSEPVSSIAKYSMIAYYQI